MDLIRRRLLRDVRSRAEDRAVFEEMTEEMVELRLQQHRDSLLHRSAIDAQAPIVMSVSHANRRPILRFDRARRPDIPDGPVAVQALGETDTFQFKKIAVNVATRLNGGDNVLPDLLRRLLGPSTGQPGIRHTAQLVRDDDVWRLERTGAAPAAERSAKVLPFPKVPFFSDVKVACGHLDAASQLDEISEPISIMASVAIDPKKHFVVTAEGDSMNGGPTPIADGDLVLCEWTRGQGQDTTS